MNIDIEIFKNEVIGSDLINNLVNKDFMPIIDEAIKEGLLDSNTLSIISAIVKKIQPARTLEIGLASGASAMSILGSALLQNHFHIAIDPYQFAGFNNRAINRLEKLNLQNRFKHVEDFSYVALPELLKEKDKFDFIFNDASHMFDHTLIEFFYCNKLLKPNGIMLFDDANWPMVANVISFVKNNLPYKVFNLGPRLVACLKIDEDNRKWYDWNEFCIPSDKYFSDLIIKYQKEKGSGFIKIE